LLGSGVLAGTEAPSNCQQQERKLLAVGHYFFLGRRKGWNLLYVNGTMSIFIGHAARIEKKIAPTVSKTDLRFAEERKTRGKKKKTKNQLGKESWVARDVEEKKMEVPCERGIPEDTRRGRNA